MNGQDMHLDSALDDSRRREQARFGQAFVFSPSGESLALTAWIRVMLEESYAPLAPTDAALVLDAHRFIAGLAPAAQELVHHPQTTSLLRALISRLGCDPDLTYVDVPQVHGRLGRPSGVAPGGHGPADRYRPDTVGRPLRDPARSGAPVGAIDWWMPVYPLASDAEHAMPTRCDARSAGHRTAPGTGRRHLAQATLGDDGRHLDDGRQHDEAAARREAGRSEERPGRAPVALAPGGLLMLDPGRPHPALRSVTERTAFTLHLRTVTLYDPQVPDATLLGDELRDYRRVADGLWLPGHRPRGAYRPGAGAPPV